MARETLAVRLAEAGAVRICDLAEQYGATKSSVLRVMLGETLKNKDVMKAVENKLELMQEM